MNELIDDFQNSADMAEPADSALLNEMENLAVEIIADIDAGEALSTSPYWRQLMANPHQADLFAVLRWIDSRKQDGPRLGRARRPYFEEVRLGQEPSLVFASSTIASASAASERQPPRLNVHSFGLFGPNGPMPLHLTEYVYDRLWRHKDSTLIQFADLFHHRLILLFYRAWADSQACVSMDCAESDRFTDYIASLAGYAQPAMRHRDTVPDHAKFFHMSHLVRQTRNPEGLVKILQGFLQLPVIVEEFIQHWITFPRSEQTQLFSEGGNNCILGGGAFLGERIPDGQFKIRLRIGPMPLARYRELSPDSKILKQIVAWIKNYLGLELKVDMQMVLRAEEVPQVQLGGMGQLGWSTWLNERHQKNDADDLVIYCNLYP